MGVVARHEGPASARVRALKQLALIQESRLHDTIVAHDMLTDLLLMIGRLVHDVYDEYSVCCYI